MRLKEKLVLTFFAVMWIVTGGMFYYQNIYLDQQAMKDMEFVVVATEDIASGSMLKEGVNIGKMPLDKSYLSDNHILYNEDSLNEIKDKMLSSSVLKGEIITKDRLKEYNQKPFELHVESKEKLNIQKGDLVNVYVQLKYEDSEQEDLMHYETYLLMENVVVQDVVSKEEGFNQNNIKQLITLHVNEEDALNYYLSTYLTEFDSRIIVLKHEDILKETKSNVAPIEEMENYEDIKGEFKSDNGSLDAYTKSEKGQMKGGK